MRSAKGNEKGTKTKVRVEDGGVKDVARCKVLLEKLGYEKLSGTCQRLLHPDRRDPNHHQGPDDTKMGSEDQTSLDDNRLGSAEKQTYSALRKRFNRGLDAQN